MPVPVGLAPPLAEFLEDLATRIALLESPQQPGAVFPISSSNLTTANASTYINRLVYVTDLNILAHSNGAHWYREDTGEQIV